MTYQDEELTVAIVAALDSVYARPDVYEAGTVRPIGPVVPVGGSERCGPRVPRHLSRPGVWLAAAAVFVLILAYPAVTSMDVGQTRQPSGPAAAAGAPSASRDAVTASVVKPLSSLHLVRGGSRVPRIEFLDHHRVTAWVASIGRDTGGTKRTATFVYDVGSGRLTDFWASLPPSDSGIGDLCSWSLRLGGDAHTYRTQPGASVQINLEDTSRGTMSITVAPTEPTDGPTICAMTDPAIRQLVPLGTAPPAAPGPVGSPGPVSPIVTSPPGPAPVPPAAAQPTAASPTQSTAQPTTSATGPSAGPSGSAAAPTQSSSPTSAATPTSTATPTAPTTDPAVQPEGGD
jgi:hypothetical protein